MMAESPFLRAISAAVLLTLTITIVVVSGKIGISERDPSDSDPGT
jgi:hypothetical protein